MSNRYDDNFFLLFFLTLFDQWCDCDNKISNKNPIITKCVLICTVSLSSKIFLYWMCMRYNRVDSSYRECGSRFDQTKDYKHVLALSLPKHSIAEYELKLVELESG